MTIYPAYEQLAVRIEFWDERVERIVEVDPLTGEILAERDRVDIYPAKHFVTTDQRMKAAITDIETELTERLRELRSEERILEAARLEERTRYDLETMRAVGYCPGIENYSRHLARRAAGSRPWTLLDYFPEDWLLFIDESHMSIPQVRGMYGGDTSRKQTLVEHGFRLPSAIDNRPLSFEEFERHVNQVVYVSATPGPYERERSAAVVEQLMRIVDAVVGRPQYAFVRLSAPRDAGPDAARDLAEFAKRIAWPVRVAVSGALDPEAPRTDGVVSIP